MLTLILFMLICTALMFVNHNLRLNFATLSLSNNTFKKPFEVFTKKLHAKITNGIVGAFSGKIGNVVGFRWKNIDAARTYAIPENPNTINQQNQRTAFTAIQRIASSVLITICQKYWKAFAIGMSEYNAFIKTSLLNGFTGSNFSNVKMSKGNLEAPVSCTGLHTSGNVHCEWDTTITGNGLATDSITCVVYDSSNHVSYIDDSGADRSTGGTGIDITVPSGADPAYLWLYVFASRLNPDGTQLPSNSVYADVSV